MVQDEAAKQSAWWKTENVIIKAMSQVITNDIKTNCTFKYMIMYVQVYDN